MCMYLYVSEVSKSLHVCVCICIHVYVLYVSYVCACMLYVLYASAQASADAITTGLAHPRGRRQPAGPTLDRHGHWQQPRHFIPRSGTHSHTRFGAPVRAARVGGANAAPLHSPWALQSQWMLYPDFSRQMDAFFPGAPTTFFRRSTMAYNARASPVRLASPRPCAHGRTNINVFILPPPAGRHLEFRLETGATEDCNLSRSCV